MNMLDRDFAPKYTELDVILAFNKMRHDLEDELKKKKTERIYTLPKYRNPEGYY